MTCEGICLLIECVSSFFFWYQKVIFCWWDREGVCLIMDHLPIFFFWAQKLFSATEGVWMTTERLLKNFSGSKKQFPESRGHLFAHRVSPEIFYWAKKRFFDFWGGLLDYRVSSFFSGLKNYFLLTEGICLIVCS